MKLSIFLLLISCVYATPIHDKTVYEKLNNGIMQSKDGKEIMQSKDGKEIMQSKDGNKIMQSKDAEEIMQSKDAKEIMQSKGAKLLKIFPRQDVDVKPERGIKIYPRNDVGVTPASRIAANMKMPEIGEKGYTNSNDLGSCIPNNYIGWKSVSDAVWKFKSENYPNSYPANKNCFWNVTGISNPEMTFYINCPKFNLEDSPNCENDYVLFNGKRFCGSSGPTGCSKNYLIMNFATNNNGKTGTGFECTVEAKNEKECAYGANSATQQTVSATSLAPVAQSPTQSAPSAAASGNYGSTNSACSCGQINSLTRIVNGAPTDKDEYPWQAGLVYSGVPNWRTWCGGTIISDRYVITAAHCTVPLFKAATKYGKNSREELLEVLIGEHRIYDDSGTAVDDGQIRKSIEKIIDHPSYETYSSGYDISLLKLKEPINFGRAKNRILPACLPTVGNNYLGKNAIVTGWGKLQSNGPQSNINMEVGLPVISNEKCKTIYGNIINKSMLCAGNGSIDSKDSCQGDSGGPLVTKNNAGKYDLIGVVSFGAECGVAPGVYTRVTEVYDWIKQNTADSVYCS